MKNVRRDDRIIFSSDNGQMALYDPQDGNFFGINVVGEFLWNQLADWIPVETLVENAVSTFDAPRELIEQDVRVFLVAMIENNLIVASDKDNSNIFPKMKIVEHGKELDNSTDYSTQQHTLPIQRVQY